MASCLAQEAVPSTRRITRDSFSFCLKIVEKVLGTAKGEIFPVPRNIAYMLKARWPLRPIHRHLRERGKYVIALQYRYKSTPPDGKSSQHSGMSKCV
jgi:hypothetical protein